MLSVASFSTGYMAPMVRPAVQARAHAQMADISAFGDVWGYDAKKSVYDAWDPAKPRDYENFNPFERNDEGAMCDFNGCFPGQSRGYTVFTRPDVSFGKMQEEKAMVDQVLASPKGMISGKPGNWKRSWQDEPVKLGAVPTY